MAFIHVTFVGMPVVAMKVADGEYANTPAFVSPLYPHTWVKGAPFGPKPKPPTTGVPTGRISSSRVVIVTV